MVAPWKTIDEARRLKGITLKEMARLVGVSQTAVQKWKNGGSIAYETVERLAVVFNTTASQIIEPPDRPPASPGEAPAATNRAASLTRETSEPSPGEPPSASGVCLYPDTCDLPAKLSSLEDRVAEMEATLLRVERLLGHALRRGLDDASDPERKAAG